MSDYTNPKPNSFSWVELQAQDGEQSKKFYSGLFGWTYTQDKLPDGSGEYIMAQANKLPAAALMSMPESMRSMGIPPHWGSYILVDNIENIINKAQSLGAEVLRPACDVTDAGRMAVLRDPQGAVFHLWQAKKFTGAAVQNKTPGAFCWNELWVPDTRKACDFYNKVFGWKSKTSEFNNKPYISLTHPDDHSVGGMMQIESDMSFPPHWAIYFTVKNINKSVEYVKEQSGQIYIGPEKIPGMGVFATCADPQGAVFSLIKFEN